MPLADFAGKRNWGYDGVLWYAPDSAYGRPDDLKALIDEAHLRGLMVFLDVVYNHFGPEGNYLGRYAPASSPRRRRRGAARSITASARCAPSPSRMRCIGCASTASTGCGSTPSTPSPSPARSRCCTISAARSGELAARDRPPHPSGAGKRRQRARACSIPAQDPPRGKYRAQWNDDYHHAWHVLLTGETHGYYGDYQRSPRRGHRAGARLGLCLSGRSLGASRRAIARRAERQPAADRLRQFPAEPRPDRQPRARRPAREHRRTRGRSRQRSRSRCWRR